MNIEDLFFKDIITQAKRKKIEATANENGANGKIEKEEEPAPAPTKKAQPKKAEKKEGENGDQNNPSSQQQKTPKTPIKRNKRFQDLNDAKKIEVLKKTIEKKVKDEKKSKETGKIYYKLIDCGGSMRKDQINNTLKQLQGSNNNNSDSNSDANAASASSSKAEAKGGDANVDVKGGDQQQNQTNNNNQSVVNNINVGDLPKAMQETIKSQQEFMLKLIDKLNATKDQKAKATIQAKIEKKENKIIEFLKKNDVDIDEVTTGGGSADGGDDSNLDMNLLEEGWNMLDDQEKKCLNEFRPGLSQLFNNTKVQHGEATHEVVYNGQNEGEAQQQQQSSQEEQSKTEQSSNKKQGNGDEATKATPVAKKSADETKPKQVQQKNVEQQIQNLYFKGVTI